MRMPEGRGHVQWLLAVPVWLALAGCAGTSVRDQAPAAATAEATVAAPAPAAADAAGQQDAQQAPAVAEEAGATSAATPVAAGAAAQPAAIANAGDASAQAAMAEEDFDTIYGQTDATDKALATPAVFDPWEKMNRRVHAFNRVVDRVLMRPLARAYVTVLPAPVRTGIGNVFDNLAAPVAFSNLLLQGRPGAAVETLGRFLVNTTIGVGGIFDPADKVFRMHRHSADFGRTLARWGWQQSRYLELPFWGPSTVRDALGRAGDYPLSPLTYVERDRLRVGLLGLQAVDLRAGLLNLDALRQSSPDEYTLIRDTWLARRRYLIDNDRKHGDEGNQILPPYLLETDSQPSPTP